MKSLSGKKTLSVFSLLIAVCYLSIFVLAPLIHQYYLTGYEYSDKVNTVNILKRKLSNMKKIKLIKFKLGYRKLSTYLLTILSYMSYLQKIGLNVDVEIKNGNETGLGAGNAMPDTNLIKFKGKNRSILKIQNVPRFKNRFGHAGFIAIGKVEGLKDSKIKKYVAYEQLTIILRKVPNINIIFSLLRIFKLFPIDIKKISINAGRNVGIIFNLKLINLGRFYR